MKGQFLTNQLLYVRFSNGKSSVVRENACTIKYIQENVTTPIGPNKSCGYCNKIQNKKAYLPLSRTIQRNSFHFVLSPCM